MSQDKAMNYTYHFLEGVCLRYDGMLIKGSQELHLPPKELGVLLILLESAGKIVSKDDIIEKVWRNTVVSDESLTRCIYTLRRIFSDLGYPKCIETIYRKGYRFSAPIYIATDKPNEQSQKAVAVFPFDCSPLALDPQKVHREIVQQITNLEQTCFSTYPVSVSGHCNDNSSVSLFLSQFKPDYYFTGKFCTQNSAIHLYIEFIDAKTNFLICCDKIELNSLAIDAHSLALAVTQKIEAMISIKEDICAQTAISVEHGVPDLAEGKKKLHTFTPESITSAIAIFQRYLHENRYDVECCCLLAECYLSLALYGENEFNKAIQQATGLLDNISEKLYFNGHILSLIGLISGLKGDSITSKILFRQAHANIANSDIICYYHALLYFFCGEIPKAYESLEKSIKLNPDSQKALTIKMCFDVFCKDKEDVTHSLPELSLSKNFSMLLKNIRAFFQMRNGLGFTPA